MEEEVNSAMNYSVSRQELLKMFFTRHCSVGLHKRNVKIIMVYQNNLKEKSLNQTRSG